MMCVLHIVISISISKCTTIVLFPLTLKTFWWINRKCHLILIMININLWVHSNDSSWTIFFSSLVVFSKYLSIHSFAHSFVLSQFSKCRLVICRHKKGRLTENHLHALWFISLCFFPLLLCLFYLNGHLSHSNQQSQTAFVQFNMILIHIFSSNCEI